MFCVINRINLVLLNSEKVVPETVVILADEHLLRLPLESLSVLKSTQVQCLARDLSLQMHYYRFHSTADVSGINANDLFTVTVFT